MGVSGQGEQPLSPKTQKNDDDSGIRKIIIKQKYSEYGELDEDNRGSE